jgi:ubiquinone/menaquinone biosynthesis C-methylase UbiE
MSRTRFSERAPEFEAALATPFHHGVVDAVEAAIGEVAPGVAIEVGCGAGTLVDAWRTRGHRVIGVDATFEMCAATRVRAGVLAACADACRLPFAADSADVLASTFCLQIVPDPGAALREAARVLRPGGRCAIAIQAPDWTESGAFDLAARLGMVGGDCDHLVRIARVAPGSWRFSTEELRALFADSGLEDIVIVRVMAGVLVASATAP